MAPNPTFQRARNDEQIGLRRDDILRAARNLLAQKGPRGVTLMTIGKGVGLSKLNIYRYFESREDVLCQVFLQEAGGFVADISSGFRSVPDKNDISVCSVLFAQACGNHHYFSMLHSQFAVNLKENISVARIAQIKTAAAALIQQAADALLAAVPNLGADGALDAMKMMLRQLSGAWPFAHPGGNVRAALTQSELDMFDLNFRQTFSRNCFVIMNGLLKEPQS